VDSALAAGVAVLAHTIPAAKGRVEKGMDADLVVLDADPARDVRNLAKVMYTIRGGQIMYSSQGKLE
jgi:imidazolonepropionase-like amidohydrolase